MKTLQFKCKLLSDVILNQRAATEGNQESLTFIPGNCFLGIVAKDYMSFPIKEQTEIFHSGHVRFGDAHPASKEAKTRSLHIPASLFYPKLKSLGEESYIHHFYSRSDDKNGTQGQPQQLKQCREGYYEFAENEANAVDSQKSFAIKSAYDRTLRKSKDSQMFGYEGLEKGSEFYFSVEIDDEALAPIIEEKLTGRKHVGRSKTAQYGLIEITKGSFQEIPSAPSLFSINGNSYITVYADGRLIFLDETGTATFQPTAQMLGLNGEIDWEKSQIRTFQYAPWNGKRQTRDADRVGIEKGSVFVVKLHEPPTGSQLPSYVGNYNNEGFGKVIYGWNLLQKAGENGQTDLQLSHKTKAQATETRALEGTPLLAFLARKKHKSSSSVYIYEQVNHFVKMYKPLFSQGKFSAQWGAIRNIALQNSTMDKILLELFDKTELKKRVASPTDSSTQQIKERGYIAHGIKKKDWENKQRGKILREFIEQMGNSQEYGDLSQRALVNLASEMAKNNKAMQMTKYKYRMIARITLEATSPLAVGSGEKDIITDAPVARDVNDLPYIPGTSLMGIIRHSIKDLKESDSIIGGQEEGSKVLISDALLLGSNQKAMDGLKDIEQDEYIKAFEVLPIRQHVRITEKGTGADHGKFDEQVVYKGTRFIFEMELLSETKDDENMQKLLDVISSPTFRVGSGTRNGFGSMKVVSLKYASYDLTLEKDLDAYLKKSSSLEEDWNEAIEMKASELQGADWIKYTLTLKPLNFFLFSSGFGDEDADMTPVKENYVNWSTGKPEIKEAKSLIPATSVKGAISHRTAYHWNRLTKHFVDNAEAIASDRNKACLDIFGTTLDEGDVKPSRGKAIFSDVFIENTDSKVLPHIRVDKFTGGVMDGALFQEKVSTAENQELVEEIWVEKEALQDEDVRKAFEKALQDICDGLLPLGGGTNRGNGIFIGTLNIQE